MLEVYDPIRLMKSEVYSRIYTGVRHVLMEVRENIPSQLRIGALCITADRSEFASSVARRVTNVTNANGKQLRVQLLRHHPQIPSLLRMCILRPRRPIVRR